jgi:hypothetical protein
VDAAMERVQEITAALPKQTRKGATTVKGEIEFLEPVQVGQEAYADL